MFVHRARASAAQERNSIPGVEECARRFREFEVDVAFSSYRYEGVRYTNWGKIPVVMPTARCVLALVAGEEWTRTVSLRAHALNAYSAYAWLLGLSYAFVLLATLGLRWRRRRKPSQTVPAEAEPVDGQDQAVERVS